MRFLKLSDAEVPEDVKATLDVFHPVEDRVDRCAYHIESHLKLKIPLLLQ
jgi:hypothetical protein